MAFAQGSRSSLSYTTESTFGTTPAGNFLNLPFSTHSLNLTKDRVAGNDIQSDRMPRVDRHGNRKTAGDIVVDLRNADYDAFIESAMLSSWTTSPSLATLTATSSGGTATITFAAQTVAPFAVGSTIVVAGVTPTGFNGSFSVTACTTTSVSFLNATSGPQSAPGTVGNSVIKVGVTPKFFSIEDFAADIGQARLFTGMTVSSMGISLAPNQMVTTTFSMVGKDMTISSSQKTQTAASGAAPFDAYSGDVAIGNVASSALVAIVTGIDFTINNSFAPTFVVGDAATPALQYGKAEIEGTFTAYFEDLALVNRFLNETESELSVSVNDPTGTNLYTFLFPRIKINSADVGVDGPTSRMIKMSFVALYDSTQATNLKITR
jgi:hypothetical protein